MGKKLASLLVVLALAGAASAARWVGPTFTDSPGNWTTTTNWDTYPTATDDIVRLDRSDGLGSNIIIDGPVDGGIKIQMKYGSVNLLITSTGHLWNDGSVEQGEGTYTLVTIQAGGVFDACQKLTQTIGTYKLSSAAGSQDIIDVYGTLNVKGSLANSDLQIGAGSGAGYGRVYIRDGGKVDVDVYGINGNLNTLGTAKRGMITIADGGIMRILGDVRTQVDADIAAGNIVSSHLSWLQGGYTYVPEPATIALLGLGGLLLRRKH